MILAIQALATRAKYSHYQNDARPDSHLATMASIATKAPRPVCRAVRFARIVPRRPLTPACVSPVPVTPRLSVAATAFRGFHGTVRCQEREPIKHGPRALLPEFSLKDKVIIVSGGAQGLGLVQAEALLEAGAAGILGTFPDMYPPAR